jgi:hypothetical protein
MKVLPRLAPFLPTRDGLRSELPAVVVGLVVGAAVVGFAVLGAALSGSTAFFFMHEAQEVLDGPWYAGSVSVLTGLLWWTAATAGLVAALVLRGSAARPFAFAAGLSAVLAVDDLLRLHEIVFPQYLGLGEKYLTVGYLFAYLAYGYLSRHISARRGRVGLLLALGLLGFSAFADFVLQNLFGGEFTVLEDGSKTLGVAVWAAVQVHFAAAELRSGWSDPAPTGSVPGPRTTPVTHEEPVER